MKSNRVEQHQIKKTDIMWKIIDDLCFKSKNVYNCGNYIIRQEFINNHNYISSNDLDKIMQKQECYSILGSQAVWVLRRHRKLYNYLIRIGNHFLWQLKIGVNILKNI